MEGNWEAPGIRATAYEGGQIDFEIACHGCGAGVAVEDVRALRDFLTKALGGESWVDGMVASVKARIERGDPDLHSSISVIATVEWGTE
jgi:hypothetical protein